MERVRNLLRVLLRRALSEHGREAPALTDITIERASGRFEPRLGAHFANGYCTWAPVRPDDCYAVCERYAAWDLPSLRRALLCEAHEIYARMCAEHLAEVGRARERRSMAAAIFDRHPAAHGAARPRLRRGSRTAEPEPVRRARRTRAPAARRRSAGCSSGGPSSATTMPAPPCSAPASAPTSAASARRSAASSCCEENLTAAQRRQYEKYGYFDVTGGKTGKRYRIRHGRQMNIEQLDRNGRRVCGWCFFPQGSLVSGDVMLAQKAALELFEADALRIANRF